MSAYQETMPAGAANAWQIGQVSWLWGDGPRIGSCEECPSGTDPACEAKPSRSSERSSPWQWWQQPPHDATGFDTIARP
ncbi:hypothetical protein [Crateriforma conspicua]|uniref:hypothetical protein n=1 Tax=Crateriforma conspicua TaxID=2527996 RepID=UPI0011B7B5AF|nr:hypothetical protein [Crateriforma conspicua]